MAALAASDWTLALSTMSPHINPGSPARRKSYGTMALPATKTYPTGGVPLPTFDKFGFVRQLSSLQIIGFDGQPTAVAGMPTVDLAESTLQFWPTAAELANSVAPGPITLRFVAEGW